MLGYITIHLIGKINYNKIWREQKQKAMRLNTRFITAQTYIHNIYIATYPPVDVKWEDLSRSQEIKKNTHMYQYYVDHVSSMEEFQRLYQHFTNRFQPFSIPNTELEMEQMSFYLQSKLHSFIYRRQQEEKALFSNGQPRITTIFLVMNILFFLFIEAKGGSTSTLTLITYGAKYNPAILDGEWWRIISSMFIHIGILHLFMNMLALYFVGSAVEKIYGSGRFTFIYVGAGIMGGLASFAWNPQIAAGASGAIFGLLGALLFFGVNYKRVFFQTMGWNLIIVILLNIVFGVTVPQIDNGAHMGGLIGGFVAAAIVFFPSKRNLKVQLLACLSFCVIISGLLVYGLTNMSAHYSAVVQTQLAQELIEQENYQEVIEVTTLAIDEQVQSYQAELHFFRSYAWLQLGRVEEATNDLLHVVQIDSSFAEAHYNLALIYADEGNVEEAHDHAERASQLQPSNQDFQDLFQRLSKE
ncbi:rhomboid family intramembrane serine protease [Aquibacillus sediminis]|uniref:rhomboid family intramembrane serine protease n=1 Tax=Aquibacillus sediminis TaxID=2574734 RepID=UPI001107D738|nr:rhomboid family intramembrane serine protease [Aquibacillus sediminis]